jgi:hypothetical protein
VSLQGRRAGTVTPQRPGQSQQQGGSTATRTTGEEVDERLKSLSSILKFLDFFLRVSLEERYDS